MWQEVLGISRVGVTDNFFELGGHSLKAIQVLSRVRTIMQLSVELSVLFTFPDIRRLAAALNSAASQPVPPVLPVAPAAFYDVSASQQTLWLSAQLQRSAAVYNIPGAYMLHGKLDTASLEQAFRALIQRHEILRTVFPLIDGRIRQQVIPAADHHYHMPLIDLQAATGQEAQVKHWANQAASLEMDIEKGPLLHTTLLRLSAEKHLLLFTMHHLVADGWSMEVIIHDLLAYYYAFTNNLPEPLQPLKVQYKDFAAWQNRQLEGDAYEMHLQYWKNQFADTPPVLALPLDKQPNKDTPAAGTDIPFAINGATRAALEQLCRDSGITMYTLLLSAYQLLFAAIARQTDLVVATPFAGRTHPDLEPLVGPFMNTLPIRIKLLPEEKISALLQRVQQQLLEAFKHGMVTLERFAGLLNGPDTAGPHNFYQVGFTWQNTQQITGNNGPDGFEDLEVELYDTDDKYVKTTCWLHAADLGDRIQCSLLYNHALLLPETAAVFTRLFLSILEMMIAAPETIATRLLLDPAFAVKRKPMSKKFSKENTFSQFLQTKTAAVQVTAPELVKITPPANGLGYPLMITPTVPGVSLLQWLQQHTGEVQQHLQETGALLFRDFEINGLADFHSFAAITGGPPMDYMDQSSPRSRLADKVYTSTDQPSSQHINMHNELSYSRHWPLQIIFHCMQLQCTGGETPICDSRRVLAQLSPATRRRFEEKGIMYYRNLQEGFGLSWQDVYQTNDPEAVAAYCRLHNIRFSWKSEQQLQTWWVKPAIVKHPVTGEPLWFNHGLFFNERSLAEHIREGIGAEELPFNTFYGDGSPIEPEVIAEIASAYAAAKVVFPWKKGDILLLDNMLMSHGRNPYDGARKIVVSMNTPCNDDMLR
ncbi:condensation domain-containing protein [Chitinophaga rupis]|uniref:condensation domain-containing protein n=1 Tax=Chitinophaga rupis TaxID=573321 RepID=UPI00373FD07A